jgi:hypothetical protein
MEFSLEQRFRMVASALSANVGSIAKAVDKKFGAQGRDVLRQVQSVEGVTMGEMFKPMSSGEDFKSVGTLYARIVKMLGVDIEVKVKKDEVVIKVPKCPYDLEGTSRELCEAMMAADVSAVKTMSPNVTLEIVKTVAAGDLQCELSITPKK